MDAKSGYFLAGDVAKSSPALYRERQSNDANFARFTTYAPLPIFPEESCMGTRVNPDTSWIILYFSSCHIFPPV